MTSPPQPDRPSRLLTSAIVEVLAAGGFALVTSKLVSLPIIAVSGFVLSRAFVFMPEAKP